MTDIDNNGEGTLGDVDFSGLPDLVWVEIMSYLSLGDRYSLSRCCHALNNAFNHPSLWHTVNIALCFPPSRQQPFKVPEIYHALVSRFASSFRDLSLHLFGTPRKMSCDFGDKLIAHELGDGYNLERLMLNATSVLLTDDIRRSIPNQGTMHALLTFVRSASRLKSLVIKSWPIHNRLKSDLDILHVIQTNNQLRKTLTSLSLFWPRRQDWVKKNERVPTLSETRSLLGHLSALQFLSIRSTMLSPDVLETLASVDHVPLQKLQILLIYSQFDDQLPEIPSSSWAALKGRSPRLRVECSVMTRIPMVELAVLLKPEVPLEAVTFLKHSYCDGEILDSLAAKYHQTLRKLIDFTDGKKSDNELIKFLTKCRNVTYLVYHRDVHFAAVPRAAQVRKRTWEQFEFREAAIDTRDDESPEDEDVIVGERQPGVFFLRPLERFHEMADARHERMVDMTQAVRDIVGYNWRPI